MLGFQVSLGLEVGSEPKPETETFRNPRSPAPKTQNHPKKPQPLNPKPQSLNPAP